MPTMTRPLLVALTWFLVQACCYALLESDVRSTSGIVTLELLDASTMTLVTPLVDGIVIGVDTIPGMLTPSFNILATIADNTTDSVHFGLNDVTQYRSDGSAPFTLCESQHCTELGYGTHSVTATPYNSQGEPGPSTTMAFSIVPSANPNVASTRVLLTATRRCNVPKLVGAWQRGTSYPLSVAEAQGSMIGTTFLLVSGFNDGFDVTTRQTYTLDTSVESAVWMQQDDVPIRNGVTHAAYAVVGQKFYMCGGYVGGSPGPHTKHCLTFDLSKPRGQQWTSFASLPDGGRGGGGMVYDSTRGALIFSGGAQRPSAGSPITVDKNTTWMYSLNTPGAKWTNKAPIPFFGNHIGFVTTTDITGAECHYFVGGQAAENEANGNKRDHFEYHVLTDTWIRRASMPIARGHASSSTRAVGCGYLIAGGATNGKQKLSDISYYHVPTNKWTSIGNLPKSLNTPVCDVVGNKWLYCESGLAKDKFSYKIQISL